MRSWELPDHGDCQAKNTEGTLHSRKTPAADRSPSPPPGALKAGWPKDKSTDVPLLPHPSSSTGAWGSLHGLSQSFRAPRAPTDWGTASSLAVALGSRTPGWHSWGSQMDVTLENKSPQRPASPKEISPWWGVSQSVPEDLQTGAPQGAPFPPSAQFLDL